MNLGIGHGLSWLQSFGQVQQHKAEHLEDCAIRKNRPDHTFVTFVSQTWQDGDYRFRLMDIKGSVSQRVDAWAPAW